MNPVAMRALFNRKKRGPTNPFLTALLATNPVAVYGMGDITTAANSPEPDLTGNGLTATAVNFGSDYVAQPSLLPNGEGGSVGFSNGVGSTWVVLPFDSRLYNLGVGGADWTISFWVRAGMTVSSAFLQTGTSGIGLSFVFDGTGAYNIVLGKAGVSNNLTFSHAFVDGAGGNFWIAITSVSGLIKMYVNSVADPVTGSPALNFAGSGASGQIGAYNGGNSRWGEGSIPPVGLVQYVAFHNVGLTQGQINALWASAQ